MARGTTVKRADAWWRETLRLRLIWLAAATAAVLAFAFVIPLVSSSLPDRLAGLLRPAFGLAALSGLLLVVSDGLDALHRRHDRGRD